MKKPQIIFTKKSPYLLVNGQNVTDEKGKPIEIKQVTQICRCGKSEIKPYCDNSHELDGIDSEKNETRHKNKWRNYVGDNITIHYNLGLCCHVGLCMKFLPTVFNKDFKPWIHVNGASIEEIISTISKCPSGALTYTKDGEYVSDFESEIHIKLVMEGPMVVKGDVELLDDLGSVDEIKALKRYSLCCCGKSKNKPYCDGTHRS